MSIPTLDTDLSSIQKLDDYPNDIGGLSAASSANAVSGKAVMSTSTASNTASDLLSFLIF